MLRVAKNRKMFKNEQNQAFFQRFEVYKKLNMRIFLKFYPSKDLVKGQNMSNFFKNLPASY